MKATDLLREQHRTVEALFAKIEAGEPDALRELASTLAAHMTIEHEFFYPVARDTDEDAIAEAFEEHAIAEIALKRALATAPDEEPFAARIKVLRELIEHHLEEEESELFPQVEAEMEPIFLEALGQKMEMRFEVILKRGYASVFPSNFEQTTADIAQTSAAE